MNNQLFRKYPSIDFFEKFIKIYGIKDLNDSREISKYTLINYNTLEKFEDFVEELSIYYLPCKKKKYIFNIKLKILITILIQLGRIFNYSLKAHERYINNEKVLFYSLENENQKNDYVNYNLKIIEF